MAFLTSSGFVPQGQAAVAKVPQICTLYWSGQLILPQNINRKEQCKSLIVELATCVC